jgi:hypothetical protein
MRHALGILITTFAVSLLCAPARADLILSIAPFSISATPGDVGDQFDVVLTNSGPSSISVGQFNFEVSVANANITLTGADFSTVAFTYIFAGHSVDQDIPLTLNFTSGQTLDANDIYDTALSGVTFAPGESLSLGRVEFDVSPAAPPAPIAVSFTGTPSVADSNNLSDGVNLIPITTFSDGVINVSGGSGSVPEPSSFLLMLTGSAAIAGLLRRRRA